LPFAVHSITWKLPPLSKVRVEFVGAETLPEEGVITFELVGPSQRFGTPDRWISEHGSPVEVPAQAGVPLEARFLWSPRPLDRDREPDRLAFGNADPVEGGCTLLRVPVAGEPVKLRVRPIRGDGTPVQSTVETDGSAAWFDANVEWTDSRGFRWRDVARSLVADKSGMVEFEWWRPSLRPDEHGTTIHVAMESNHTGLHRRIQDQWPGCDLPWPTGADLDVGTLEIPSAK
jgi:hypothetical protein